MIKYVTEEDLIDHINEYDVILVGTNTYCTMSHGLQLKVMLNYPYVMESNMKTKYGDKRKLGTILECKGNDDVTFCLCFITMGYNFRPDKTPDYLSYESLENCLKLINVIYKDKRIATTLLGSSKFDGNGDEERITKLFNTICPELDLTIYKYKQLSRGEELKKVYRQEQKVKKKDPELYYKMVSERKKKAEERYTKNKHRRY